jgi:hypothetical protein
VGAATGKKRQLRLAKNASSGTPRIGLQSTQARGWEQGVEIKSLLTTWYILIVIHVIHSSNDACVIIESRYDALTWVIFRIAACE